MLGPNHIPPSYYRGQKRHLPRKMKLNALALAGILGLASAKYDNTTERHCTGECQSGKGAFSVWPVILLFHYNTF